MAFVEDRWKKNPDRSGQGRRWLLRWRDPDGRERKMSFRRKVDADAQKSAIEADTLRGGYIDPTAGRQIFDDFAAEWLASRTSDPATFEATAGRLRRYVTGTPLGQTPLGKIRPSTVQSWLSTVPVAPSTTRTVFAHVSAILETAADDGLIGRNPCSSKSVTLPKIEKGKIIPWTHERVDAVHANIGARYQPLVTLGADLGLRPGETYGLSPDDVEWLRPSGSARIHVRRQVKIVKSPTTGAKRRVFALPKGGKERTLLLYPSVRDELAAYLATFPAQTVTLPWGTPEGPEETVRLLVTNGKGQALHGVTVTRDVWRPALDAAGVPRGTDGKHARENGAHALRHYYASVLLDGGEPIKTLQEYLGHASAQTTLGVYAHLMPWAGTRALEAIEHARSARFSCAPHAPQARS